MKKVIVRETGAPEVLQLVDGPTPQPKAGEVLVDVEAAGINYIDVYQREGHIDLPKPFTPGLEGVGTVRRIGPGVTSLKSGDRAAWINVMGSYAGQLVIPVEQAIPLPANFSVDQALVLFQGITAQYLLAEYRQIKPGDVALVHAAAGGVGQILIQWLKHLGAVVIGTASNEEKLKTIRALGADHAVNYSKGFLEAVLEMTGGRGVDVAYDAVGATTFADTTKALARRGTGIIYGRASGNAPDVEMHPLLLKGARVAGASLFEYIDDPAEMQGRAQLVIQAVLEGWIRPTRITIFALDEAVAAHHAIQGRSTQGKLALVPRRSQHPRTLY